MKSVFQVERPKQATQTNRHKHSRITLRNYKASIRITCGTLSIRGHLIRGGSSIKQLSLSYPSYRSRLVTVVDVFVSSTLTSSGVLGVVGGEARVVSRHRG